MAFGKTMKFFLIDGEMSGRLRDRIINSIITQ